MSELPSNLTLLIPSGDELPAEQLVWGTGGWLPPEEREALDWLTLARFLGWGVTIVRPVKGDFGVTLSGGGHRIVIAGDPDSMDDETTAQLVSRISSESILLVARAGVAGGLFARLSGISRKGERMEGRSLHWTGPGPEQRWSCDHSFEATISALSTEASIWATLDGIPIIAVRRVGRGLIAALGFHPSSARDRDGAATALLRRLIVWGSDGAAAWLDWEGTLVLRMDDPGGAENVHHRIYAHTKLGQADWIAMGADLKRRHGRLSIGYVSGWVDDGDAGRGVLCVAGRKPKRIPGAVHPSPLVQYEATGEPGHTIFHDYIAEYRGIEALRSAGVADVELHGHTHMHPDTASWAKAADRYDSVHWYRELGAAMTTAIANRPASRHPLVQGMAAFHRFFKTQPTTLICPGEQWTHKVLTCALELGLDLIGSYYLALRDGNRFCWAQHICAPYLDRPDAAWFGAGLPVVGYFHDFDISRNGVAWFCTWLDAWRSAGANRIIDFRELAAGLGHRLYLEERGGELHLTILRQDGPEQVRPFIVAIRTEKGSMPAEIRVHRDDGEISVPVETLAHGIGRIRVPVPGSRQWNTELDCDTKSRKD